MVFVALLKISAHMSISISHTDETLLYERCTNHAKYSRLCGHNSRIGRIREHSIVTKPTVVYQPW